VYYKKQSKNPSYKFSNFKKACKDRNKIAIHSIARKEACKFFNLCTEKAILNFIKNDGLENLLFLNTKPWEQNPNKTTIMVDAYEFTSGNKKGYIAYIYNKNTNKWFIKSFHLSENMNDQMAQAIKKSELLKKLGLEE
jgi:hypothetical protein